MNSYKKFTFGIEGINIC